MQMALYMQMSAPSVEDFIQSLNVFANYHPQTSSNLTGNFFSKAITPVILTNMLPWLQRYLNRQSADLLIKGFQEGFLIPRFLGLGCTMVNNLKSVSVLPLEVNKKLETELSLGRISGPFDFPPFSDFRLSPLGLVPKKELNKYHLIHHLSFPDGSSLNDQITDDLLSVLYASFEQAVQKIQLLGGSVLLAKANLRSDFFRFILAVLIL